jgi:hypothetical protein
MFSVRSTLLYLCFISGAFSAFSASAAVNYTPAPSISLTGSSGEVFFDVADDIINVSASTSRPVLDTNTRTFS